MPLELTPAEEKMVLELRHHQIIENAKAEMVMDILKVASDFEVWLRVSERGASYSTFADEFYRGSDSNRNQLYRHIMAVREMAHDLVWGCE